jgi:signal transduction histidine kinase/ligand-binding sensor domain-containing protein
MKGKIQISLFIIFLIIFQGTHAQNNSIPFYKVDSLNGTQLGRITGITQDPSGTMWFAGEDQHSLYRYDGNMLTSFRRDAKNPNSLGLNDLETIYADDQGLIWIGGGGLDQYNPATGIFKHFTHNDNDNSSITNGSIFAILRDHTGNIWVGTDNGLDRLDERTGKFIHYRTDSSNPKSLSNNVVDVLYEDKKGMLWIGTGFPWTGINGDGGLNRMNPDGSFTRYVHNPKNPNSLLSNKVRAIFEDSRGNFWVGTSGDGLHTMDRGKETFERHLYNPKHPNQLSGPLLHPGSRSGAGGITYIYEDKIGAIWIGSYLEGLSRYDPVTKQMTRYKMGNGFPDSTTYKGFVSKDGTLWVAADDSKLLYRADPGSKTISNIYIGSQVWGMLANNGKIWVATWGGLLQYDENRNLIHKFKHDPKDPSTIPNDSVYHILKISQDTFWVSTQSGIVLLNSITNKFSKLYLGKNIDPIKFYFDVFKDKKEDLWLITPDGLIQFNHHDSSVKKWYPDPADSDRIGSHFISFIFEDKEQNLWFGTWQEKLGIWKFNSRTGKFRRYLPGIIGRNLFEDREGDLWAGTSNGLYRYNKKEDGFSLFFDSQSKISNELTVGIEEDNKNNLWLSTPSSIVKINQKRNSFFVFGKKFGISLQEDIFIGQICRTALGQMVVGNDKGFYAFYPEELDVDMKPLELVITDFFFNMGSRLSGKDGSLLISAERNSEISLAHDQNNFGFKYAVYDYRSPEAMRYYTMLENYDPVWRQSGTDKTVYYFNLAPGDYVFRVKVFNSDELKGERQIKIHISPPWWKTGWAYAAYGLLLITIIFAIVSAQKQRIIREERHKTQTRELAQAKEIEKAYTELKATQAQLIQSEKMASLGELTAGIAHEIQNPLNFVNNFSEVNMELTTELKEELAKLNIDTKEKILLEEIANNINDNEEKINHHGRRADAIVKGMLQHSRISSGLKEPTNINQLADEFLRLAYHGLRAKDKSFNTAMKTDFDQGIGNINIVSQDVGRVLLNLYNNAFYAVAEKKQQQGGSYEPVVEVNTRKTGGKVEIIIKDNGNGIPKKVLDKIFQPFFTTKPTGQGTGLGLSLSFDIVKSHGGEIKVDTIEGQYTSFILSLPG